MLLWWKGHGRLTYDANYAAAAGAARRGGRGGRALSLSSLSAAVAPSSSSSSSATAPAAYEGRWIVHLLAPGTKDPDQVLVGVILCAKLKVH